MSFLSWLFGSGEDNRDRRAPQQEAERKLSTAMPMAAAGAELSAQSKKSETENALKRAAKLEPKDRDTVERRRQTQPLNIAQRRFRAASNTRDL